MWFEELTGFAEESPQQVRENLVLEGEFLTSLANGRRMRCGRLEIPKLSELRERIPRSLLGSGSLAVREVVADVRDLHRLEENHGALFQVASQANLLEMVSPAVTPDEGIDVYEEDFTQGPACAIACGAGTIYRNYFVELEGRRGQTASRQVDTLRDLGRALGNADGALWEMRNGYLLAKEESLIEISSRLRELTPSDRDSLRALVRVGIQWDTEVTIAPNAPLVTQVYASALPVRYGTAPDEVWEDFARLVLEAAYEATFCAALLNASRSKSSRVFLTLLGGGAFGNRSSWILDALGRSLDSFANTSLEVFVVSFGGSHPAVRALCEERSS